MVKKYVKRPVSVEAIQYTDNNLYEVLDFVGKENYRLEHVKNGVVDIMICTLEGDHRCNEGDYIIKGIKGEFYPCKPDIFGKTYNEEKRKTIKLNIYHSDGNYMGVTYGGTLKEFIKKADKGKNIKLISNGREWFINSALISAFEEVKE